MKTTIVFWVLVAGCAGVTGRPFNAALAAGVVAGKMTTAEVLASLGPPLTATPEVPQPGSKCRLTGEPVAETWVYSYTDKNNACVASFSFDRNGLACSVIVTELKRGRLCSGGQP